MNEETWKRCGSCVSVLSRPLRAGRRKRWGGGGEGAQEVSVLSPTGHVALSHQTATPL